MKIINFDMDGTLADLYGVRNWLNYLINNDTTPYRIAKPLVNMQELSKILTKLQQNGYEINIISWLSKNGNNIYDREVTKTKIEWLNNNLNFEFNNIYIVKYGTPKHSISSGILFDDEKKNRIEWGEGAYNVDNILNVLRNLI